MIYSAMCQLNGLDMLDSKFNKGTLDLEPELREHPLYRDIWEAIQNYNSIYDKVKNKHAPQTFDKSSGKSVIELDDGQLFLRGDSKRGEVDIILDQSSKEVMVSLNSTRNEEVWPALQAAKEDLIYEFQVLMGTIVNVL